MAGNITYSDIISSGAGKTTVRLSNGQTRTFTGSRGYRNNNPGNLTSDSKSAKTLSRYTQYGAMGYDYGGNMIFSSMQGGFNAQKALVTGTYKNHTIGSMLNRYAPPGAANDPNGTNASYPGYMQKQGWDMNTKISDLTPEQQNQMIADMIRKENSTSDANKILNEVDLGETSEVQEGDQQVGEEALEDNGEDGTHSNFDDQSADTTAPRNDKIIPSGEIGFKDPDRNFPLSPYYTDPTTNTAARENWEPKLKMGGGGLDKNLWPTSAAPKYPHNKVTETTSGHRIELDDTPGEERLTMVHAVGSGIEMHADGVIVLNSYDKTVQVVGDDFTLYVRGNGEVSYEGDLKMHVRGDMELKVDNNFTLDVGGKIIEKAMGGKSETSEKDKVVTVVGNLSETVTKNTTRTSLESNTQITKGDDNTWVSGSMELLSKDKIHVSSETEINSASPAINATAVHMALTANSGVIGGGLDGFLFHGRLKGTATGLWNNLSVAYTYAPDNNTVLDTLYLSDKGVYDVDIDPGDKILEAIDLRETTNLGKNKSTNTSSPTNFNLVP